MRSEWKMVALAAAFAMLAAACGGKSAESFSDNDSGDPDPAASPGPEGSVVLIEFVTPDSLTTEPPAIDGSTVFRSSIGPVGTSNPQGSLLRFRVLNKEGRPAKNGVRVRFTLEGPPDALLTQIKDESVNGFVETVLQAGPTPGNAVVTVRVNGSNLSARSPVITIGRPPGAASSMEFFGLRVPGLIGDADDDAGTPAERTLLGVRGSGFAQAVDVVFVVLDDQGGAAADGTIVDFSLFGPNGGESISPVFDTTANGFVSATISTGTRPGPVQVTAQVRGTSVRARAIPITIGTALNPSANRLSIAAECLNVAGSVTFGLRDNMRAGLSDQFGNAIPIGSAVSFFAEGGGIFAQGISGDGLEASADLVTQLPIPADRRVQVMAVTTGQETFTDVNGNAQFDPGEPFVDQAPEPFLDHDEDGFYDVGEFFLDQNNNGVYDATPNGVWDAQILIAAQMPIVFSGPSTISIDPTTFMLAPGESETFTLIISDDIGSALVGTTEVDITGNNVEVAPQSFGIPDTNVDTTSSPVFGVTAFTVVVSNTAEPSTTGAPLVEKPASFTVSVDSENEGDERCPGGNNSIFATIFGTVRVPATTGPTPTPTPTAAP